MRALVITGPTASGKTHLAVEICRRFGGEIISADSRQVYRGMDIGTGKDLGEYSEGGEYVPYHLIDIAEPDEDFHLFKYLGLAKSAIKSVSERGKLPVVCGGTPLYIKALLDGYDQDGGAPDLALRDELMKLTEDELVYMLKKEADERLFARTDFTQKRRIIRSIELARFGKSVEPVPVIDDALIIAPYYERKTIHKRVEKRLDERLANGMLDEISALHMAGMSWDRMEWLGLEYRFAARFLKGDISFEEMRSTLLAHIRQFCKHQDGWFRKLERDGKSIYWIKDGDIAMSSNLIQMWLAGQILPQPELRLDEIRYN